MATSKLKNELTVRCGKCVYWNNSAAHRDDTEWVTGRCERHAPVADDRSGFGRWPFTEETDGCGDGQLDPELVDEDEPF